MSGWAAAAMVGGQILGGILGDKAKEDAAGKEYQRQKEFAQHGIRWKVADAQAAKIHPLYALGAQSHSYAPQMAGGSELGRAIQQSGQDIGRAAMAQQTQKQRQAAAAPLAALTLERASLENDMLRAQINRINNPSQLPPALPGPASDPYLSGDAQKPRADVIDMPQERIAAAPGLSSRSAGAVTETALLATPQGYAVVPSKDAKERFEDYLPAQMQFMWRNSIKPLFGGKQPPPPPKSALRRFPGAIGWKFNAGEGTFTPRYPAKTRRNKSKGRGRRGHNRILQN